MTKIHWNQIENELKRDNPSATMRDADGFWQEFKEQAESVPQKQQKPLAFLSSPLLKVAACIAFGIILYSSNEFFSQENVANQNTVKNLEIFASYSATIIMDDHESEGTVIWIADLSGNEDQDSENL